MHIKKIIIQGFKTYKNTTVIDVVSPHHNVVVGRNGSGKSNFFSAIRFVLSDAYTHMTREERQGLIHEGSGTVMSAYVEVVFDNTDRRFPVAKDEFNVRRTIGLKKDDYSLDGKSATRSDIMNLLESAGFSRSNPYYIVPQGRITALTNSKDAERLALLKEVSGAKVFEAKLKESMREMTNSNLKKLRIDEALVSLDARLSDLQIESKDLKDFQSLERNKKIFEFNIFDRELNSLKTRIETAEDEYAGLLEESQLDLKAMSDREDVCRELNETIKKLKVELKLASLEEELASLDYNELLKLVTHKELQVAELRANIASSKEQTSNSDQQIGYYRDLIRKRQVQIEEEKPRLDTLRTKELEIKSVLAEVTTRQRGLFSKQSRFLKFSSKLQRDKWLSKKIKELDAEVLAKDSVVDDLQANVTMQQDLVSQYESRIKDLEQSLDSRQQQEKSDKLRESINNLKVKITEVTDERKSLWRDEVRFRSLQDAIEGDLQAATHQVNQTMDRAQAKGLASVNAIAERLNLQGSVYGPLAELFSVNDKYKTAVEVVAGNSLFHIVVDNDRTASIVLTELNRVKGGRVTFMPLNRISPPSVEFPDAQEHEFIALINKLKYTDKKIAPALKQVFGRTVVCGNLPKATELSKAFGLNAITLDGDRADTRGVLSGGFRDFKNSRIDALKSLAKKKKELQKIQSDVTKCNEQIDDANQKLNAFNNELTSNMRGLDKLLSLREPIEVELSQISNKKYNCEQELFSLTTNLDSIQLSKKNLTTIKNEYEQELESKFSQSLSDKELETLRQLTSEVAEQEKLLDNVVTELTTLETSISTYESEVSNNYKPHLQKLLSANAASNDLSDQSNLTSSEREAKKLKSQLASAEGKSQKAKSDLESLAGKISKSEALLKKENEKQVAAFKKFEKFSKVKEDLSTKQNILVLRRDEVQKKMLDLGFLPEEAFQQELYESFDSDQLLKKLDQVNQDLTKYAHINKKAMEQFATFTRERENLSERRQELEKSRDSIEALINSLERQKDDAISKSFKQVSKSFHEIFEKLVPAGTGYLIMQKRSSDGVAEDVTDSESASQTPTNVDNYTGVSISVSFNSKEDDQQRIEQLSGGQKSLCAITLILAIQKCDPAPFYLFDEIDANLDTQYRTAVAALIHSLSSSAQFICTTFRPEMLQVADKFYGVMFSNKVSTVSEINREDAMLFVEEQQQR